MKLQHKLPALIQWATSLANLQKLTRLNCCLLRFFLALAGVERQHLVRFILIF